MWFNNLFMILKIYSKHQISMINCENLYFNLDKIDRII